MLLMNVCGFTQRGVSTTYLCARVSTHSCVSMCAHARTSVHVHTHPCTLPYYNLDMWTTTICVLISTMHMDYVAAACTLFLQSVESGSSVCIYGCVH